MNESSPKEPEQVVDWTLANISYLAQLLYKKSNSTLSKTQAADQTLRELTRAEGNDTFASDLSPELIQKVVEKMEFPWSDLTLGKHKLSSKDDAEKFKSYIFSHVKIANDNTPGQVSK